MEVKAWMEACAFVILDFSFQQEILDCFPPVGVLITTKSALSG